MFCCILPRALISNQYMTDWFFRHYYNEDYLEYIFVMYSVPWKRYVLQCFFVFRRRFVWNLRKTHHIGVYVRDFIVFRVHFWMLVDHFTVPTLLCSAFKVHATSIRVQCVRWALQLLGAFWKMWEPKGPFVYSIGFTHYYEGWQEIEDRNHVKQKRVHATSFVVVSANSIQWGFWSLFHRNAATYDGGRT